MAITPSCPWVDYDVLFLHPTRQYYLRQDNDRFLKHNDRLLYAFAKHVRRTKARVKLLLARKGRRHDLRHSERLIAKLHIEADTVWLPEMPNKRLRAYYRLPQVVVCDQYSPRLAVLGNVGREASYYGRSLITAFRSWNRFWYGDDLPPHVFPAETPDEIQEAMHTTTAMTISERQRLSVAATDWFFRSHSCESVIQKWIDLIVACAR